MIRDYSFDDNFLKNLNNYEGKFRKLEYRLNEWNLNNIYFLRILDDWFNNFENHSDKELAYKILLNIDYYNDFRFNQRIENMHKNIKRKVADASLKMEDIIIITPEGEADSADRHAYDITKGWDIPTERVCSIDRVNEIIKDSSILVTFNDTHGSGSQFIRDMWNDRLERYVNHHLIIVTCISITKKALDLFNQKMIGVQFIPETSLETPLDNNSSKFTRAEYERIFELGKRVYPSHPLGYKETKLLTAYYFQCPNNTIPLIWADGMNNTTNDETYDWSPLFPYKPKKHVIENDQLKEQFRGLSENCINLNTNIEQLMDEIHNEVKSNFSKEKFKFTNISEDDFDNYSNLFKRIIECSDKNILKNDNNIFGYISDLIIESTEEYPLKVKGLAGTGKSTFLSLLYLFLYKKMVDRNYLPFYIDAHIYETKNYQDNGADYSTQTKNLIDTDLKKLFDFNKLTPEKNIIIIIDGYDEYFRLNSDCAAYIYDKIDESIKNNKKIIGLEKQINVHSERKRPNIISSLKAENSITFNSVTIFDEIGMQDFIGTYAILKKDQSFKDYAFKKIKDYSLTDIDLNILCLLYESKNKFEKEKIENITGFYRSYCNYYLGRQDSHKKLIYTAEMAYNYAMTNIAFSEKEIINNKSWSLIHKHKSFCNYLSAYYIILKLREDKELSQDLLKTVYPQEINMFMKDLLNENIDIAQRILEKIILTYDQWNTTAQTHLCYLLGRIRFDSLISKAKEFLKTKKEKTNNSDAIIDIKLRENYLLKRTISISLVYLGDKNESDDYIKQLLRDPYLNNLNRGFHLEYYGDIKFIPNQNAFVHEDKPSLPYGNTLKKLMEAVNRQIESEEIKDPLFEINLFTLCSLAQFRKIANCFNEIQINMIIKLIRRVISKQIDIYIELRDYMNFVYEILIQNNYNPAKIADIYGTNDINNKLAHIINTMWIAKLLLPNSVSYNKEKIIDILFIYGMGGIYSQKLTLETEIYQYDENELIKYILFHDTFNDHSFESSNNMPCIQSLREYREALDELYNDSNNAKIAKEIYAAIQIFQDYKSQNMDQNTLNKCKMTIKKSKIGIKILNYLITNT